MTYEVLTGSRVRRVEINRTDTGFSVRVDGGTPMAVAAEKVGDTEWLLRLADGDQRAVGLHLEGDRFSAQVDGHAIHGSVSDPRRRTFSPSSASAHGEIRTPMPGIVVRIQVVAGEAVACGQVLVVVEAMKMENEFRSPVDGTVEAIHVTPGQPVEANTLLVSVKAR